MPTADGLKASLFATIGAGDTGGIALSGHTDVVPVAGQAWDTDPFELVERDGKLYGRGTCDMKGYLACVLALVPDLKARKLKVAHPHRLLLRRGGGLHRRAADGGRARQVAAAAAHGVRRRADQHDASSMPTRAPCAGAWS